MNKLDPDFARLLERDVHLADLTPEEKKLVKEQILNLDAIKDPTTREIMKRWEKYFQA